MTATSLLSQHWFFRSLAKALHFQIRNGHAPPGPKTARIHARNPLADEVSSVIRGEKTCQAKYSKDRTCEAID